VSNSSHFLRIGKIFNDFVEGYALFRMILQSGNNDIFYGFHIFQGFHLFIIFLFRSESPQAGELRTKKSSHSVAFSLLCYNERISVLKLSTKILRQSSSVTSKSVKPLPHSVRKGTLSTLLIIAPTGVYTGRVRRGIDLVLGSQSKVKETKVRVILVAGENWIQSDESYKADFVDKVKDYVLGTWKQDLDIVCEAVVLPTSNEEHLTGWLLKELSVFFKTSRGEAEVFIDLTSAPKEWLFAAMNVLNFFPKIELYYVRPMHERLPKDYDERDVEDEGHPKLETIRMGYARQPLPQWMTPKGKKGETNIQYILFQTIFRLAQSIATEKGLDSLEELDKVWVPIEEDRGLIEYRRSLPQNLRKKFLDDSILRKSISKYLTGVDPFRLFEVKAKSVRMTMRATKLGQTLFAGKTKPHK